VSSTFSDLKEERNALQEKVFPRLRELCMQHGCRFQAIDLRWGVSEEAALDQQTMKICLGEIERCQKTTPRPNFIVLLGDRYGWRPLPAEIPADEFEQILKRVTPEESELLCWSEDQPADKKGWYRRDDNAVPPVYCLQPRTGTRHEDYETWKGEVERPLRLVLLRAAKDMPLSEDQRLKYIASATHQEIVHGAMRVADANEHVFFFFRTIKGMPRDMRAKDFIDLDEGEFDSEAHVQLQNLKQRLRQRLGDKNVKDDYNAEWVGEDEKKISLEHLKDLERDVWQSLSGIIEAEITRLKEIDPLDKEIIDHEAFGADRARSFVGRAQTLERIASYVNETSSHPLGVFGEPGSGKSALMAKVAMLIRKDWPDTIVRYVGATPASSDIRRLLTGLCEQVAVMFDFKEQQRQRLADAKDEEVRQRIMSEYLIPHNLEELQKTFNDFLTKVPPTRRLVILLDAIDQLTEMANARKLWWLPSDLPENVRMIVSTSSALDECLSSLKAKLPEENLVELEPMTFEEGRQLVELWLTQDERDLQPDQKREVLEKFSQSGLPLYLKLVFEEARQWKSYSRSVELAHDTPGLIRVLLRRLSDKANHGEIVSRSLGYLSAAKNGLTEDELLDVLSADEDVLRDFARRSPRSPEVDQLPAVIWSRLYFDLEPHFTERSADGVALLGFYHRQFAEVVASEYLSSSVRQARHCALARYFEGQTLLIGREKTPNLRKLSELPYQQTYSEMWKELYNTLTDFAFLETKCIHIRGGVYELQEDFDRALQHYPVKALPVCGRP